MMADLTDQQLQALHALEEAVTGAVAFFRGANANLFDGHQTAHEVLAHLVFWQCEHLSIAQALLAGNSPELRAGTLAEINRCACDALRHSAVDALLARFVEQHAALAAALRALDWAEDFPLKQGGRPSPVEDRVYGLAEHIHRHVMQLRRAAVTGQLRSTLN
jgi:hypothetical protein